MRIAPVIAANDPAPAELTSEADTICHRVGDMLMSASTLTVQMRRGSPLDRLEIAVAALADEARATHAASLKLGEALAALRERAEA